MLKKILLSSILIFQVYSLGVNQCFAEDFSPINTEPAESFFTGTEKTINLNSSKSFDKLIKFSDQDQTPKLLNATDRFVQCNIKASWEDFKKLIETSEPNDFTYMTMANKLSNMGLFDLANLACSKVQDKEITKTPTDAMKRFYFPKKKLKLEDELFLAETYSNILYNDQSAEATGELLKNNELLATSDYANYLAALGSYKSFKYQKANNYINIAISQNPTNLNYKKLKAEILAEDGQGELAVKTVEGLKKQKIYCDEYEKKIRSLEQYVLHKTTKSEWEKNYHLGFYYYLENDDSKAIRTLQSALSASKKKSNQALVYSLLSEIYLKVNEKEKASENAQKAYKINKNNPRTLISLGDLSYGNNNYKKALEYYKQAASRDKNSDTALIKEAQAYQKCGYGEKAKEIYTKILKTRSDSWQAYYNLAMLEREQKTDPLCTKEVSYLKKALCLNLLFKDAWLELARIELDKSNFDLAKKYLSNAFYIDENDFRYYYYHGLANKGLGDYNQAQYDFKKCLKLNTKFKEAQDELQQTFNTTL